MKKIFKKFQNYTFFLLFRVRCFTRKKAREIADFAKEGDKILEIGSGKMDNKGEYYFSNEKYFKNKSVEFIKSDINPTFKHQIIDIVNFDEKEKYEHILCFHVLDDVYEWERALINLFNAIKSGGYLHLITPGLIPLDYPADLFRFTEELIKKFCEKNNIKIDIFETHGFKRFPFAYYLRIKK